MRNRIARLALFFSSSLSLSLCRLEGAADVFAEITFDCQRFRRFARAACIKPQYAFFVTPPPPVLQVLGARKCGIKIVRAASVVYLYTCGAQITWKSQLLDAIACTERERSMHVLIFANRVHAMHIHIFIFESPK